MITISPYEDKHHAGMVAVITGCQQEFAIPVTYEQQPDLHDVRGFYQQGAGNFWVAEQYGEVIGTIALIDMGAGRGTIRKMFVSPAHRGKEHGVALKLLQTLESHAASSGMVQLLLGTAPAFKAAHRFYEKNGFVLVEEADLPADFQRMKVDNRFYAKPLTALAA